MYTFFAGSESWIGDLDRLRPVYSVHRSQGKKDRGDEHVIDSITSPLFRTRLSCFAQRRGLVRNNQMITFFAGGKSWIGNIDRLRPVSCVLRSHCENDVETNMSSTVSRRRTSPRSHIFVI